MHSELQYQINKQINAEIYSAYLYLAMSAQAERLGYKGAAHWLNAQFDEEMGHARKLISYLARKGFEVRFYTVDSIELQYSNLHEIYVAVLEHEQHVTRLIQELAAHSDYYEDTEARAYLNWFIKEQEEEEESAAAIVNALAAAAENQEAIAELDAALGQRQ